MRRNRLVPVRLAGGHKGQRLLVPQRIVAIPCLCVVAMLIALLPGELPALAATGSSWSSVPSPNPSGDSSILNGVSCTSSTFCAAVGDSENSTATDTLIEILERHFVVNGGEP